MGVTFYKGTWSDYNKLENKDLENGLYVVNSETKNNTFKSMIHNGVEIGSCMFNGKFHVGPPANDNEGAGIEMNVVGTNNSPVELRLYHSTGGEIKLKSGKNDCTPTEITLSRTIPLTVLHDNKYGVTGGVMHIAKDRYRYEKNVDDENFSIDVQVPGIVIGISNIAYRNDLCIKTCSLHSYNFQYINGGLVTTLTFKTTTQGWAAGTFYLEFDVCRIYAI